MDPPGSRDPPASSLPWKYELLGELGGTTRNVDVPGGSSAVSAPRFEFRSPTSRYILVGGLVNRNHGYSEEARRTRKLPTIRDGDQERPSVQRLIPLSSTQKTNTAPLLIMDLRSESLSRRVMRGIMP